MTDAHGDELRAAIRAAPTDRAPRLVYADWLMERDDPRGEWIALSCGQPTESTDQEMRRRALWQHHGRAWEAQDAAGSGLVEIAYRDGFPDAARLERRAHAGTRASARHPLRLLEIDVAPGVLGALASAPLLETVRCLRLVGAVNDVSEDELAAFLDAPALGRLEELRILTGIGGGRRMWPALAQCRRIAELKQLHVEAEIGAEEARWLGRSCPALEVLGCWAGIADSAMRALIESATFRLRALDIDFMSHEYLAPADGTIAELLASPMLRELASLRVMNFAYGEPTARALAQLPPTLQLLRTSGMNATMLVDGLHHCRFPALETLGIYEAEMTDDHFGVVARFPALTALEVSNAELARTCAEQIMSSLPRLEQLVLDSMRLGDNCVQAIAYSERARSLRRLSLANARAGAGAVQSIVTSGRLDELRELSLRDNPLGDDFVRSLADGPFARMTRLCVKRTMRAPTPPLFAHAWRATAESDTYERELELSGRAVTRR